MLSGDNIDALSVALFCLLPSGKLLQQLGLDSVT